MLFLVFSLSKVNPDYLLSEIIFMHDSPLSSPAVGLHLSVPTFQSFPGQTQTTQEDLCFPVARVPEAFRSPFPCTVCLSLLSKTRKPVLAWFFLLPEGDEPRLLLPGVPHSLPLSKCHFSRLTPCTLIWSLSIIVKLIEQFHFPS